MWLARLRQLLGLGPQPGRTYRRHDPARLLLERLEDRLVPVTATLVLDGGTLPAGTTSLQINFSAPVDGADQASNYQLESVGADGLLGTADDVFVSIAAGYGGSTATLAVSALPASVYRLTVADAITDAGGHALDGDGDGNPGGNYVRDFVVMASPAVPLTSPNGLSFDPAIGGFGAGQLVQGSDHAFDGFNRLQVGGTDFAPGVSTTPTQTVASATTPSGDSFATASSTLAPISAALATTVTLDAAATVRLDAVVGLAASTSTNPELQFVVDGAVVDVPHDYNLSANTTVSDTAFVALPAGTHTIDLWWASDNGGNGRSVFAVAFGNDPYAVSLDVTLPAAIPNVGPAQTVVSATTSSGNSFATASSTLGPISAALATTVTLDAAATVRLDAVLGLGIGGATHPELQFAVDGVVVDVPHDYNVSANTTVSDTAFVALPAGTHTIDLWWASDNGGNGKSVFALPFANDPYAVSLDVSMPNGDAAPTVASATTPSGTGFATASSTLAPISAALASTITLNAATTVRLDAVVGLGAGGATDPELQFAVDSAVVDVPHDYNLGTGANTTISDTAFVTLPAGTHTIDFWWASDNGGNGKSVFAVVFGNDPYAVSLDISIPATLPDVTLTNSGQTLVTGTQVLAGLDVHREITVPNTGSQDFARTVDYFQNTTGGPITTTVHVAGNLGSDAATRVFATSSGDTTPSVNDVWVGTDGGTSPAVLSIVHGPFGLKPASEDLVGDNLEWTYTLTVPAGQTLELATFTIQADTEAHAEAAANALVTSAGFGGQAAEFLGQSDLAALANFQADSPPVAGVGGPYQATVGAAVTLDGSASYDPDGTAIASYHWSFGDSSDDQDTATSTTTHAYSVPGVFHGTLTVEDQAGLTGGANFTVTVAPVALAPLLDPGSDSGTRGDGITSVRTPTLTGTADAGSGVTLFDTVAGTMTMLGSATADPSGHWSTSVALAEGVHSITVEVSENGVTSAASAPLPLTIDVTAPMLTVPANQTVEATGASGAQDSAAFSASATDAVTASPTIAYTVGGTAIDSSYVFALGTTTVQVSATDAAGNQSSGSFTVTVQDTTAPVLTLPANQTVEATSASGAKDSAAFTASATDLVTASPVIAYAVGGSAIASSYVFALGTTTVAVTATDLAGNHSSGSFTVTVRDTTAPVLTVPVDQTSEATSGSGATDSAAFSASATDAVTANPTIAYAVGGTAIASSYTFALGTTTVQVTATDLAGNQSHGSFTLTVHDTTPPVLTVPANQTVEATSASGASDSAAFSASATDAVTASPVIAYAVGGTTITSSYMFALGMTTVQVSATDAAGNQRGGSFIVTVQDTTAPVLTLPANQTVEATSAAGTTDSAAFSASATDAVTASPVITYAVGGTAIASSYVFALGTTTVLVSASDAAGNVSSGSFSVTVRDTTAPVLTVPANQTVEATSASGAKDSAAFTASATDLVTASPAIAYAVGGTAIASSYIFALGTTTVAVTATDLAGNHSSGSFTVTVHDTTPPVLTVPVDQTSEATSGSGATDSAAFSASATDAVTANPTIAYAVGGSAIASSYVFALGTTSVTVTATDLAGNHSSGNFTVTVRDTTAPVLTLPANQTVEATSASGAKDSAAFTASGTDLVTASPVIAYAVGGTAIASSYVFALGTTTVAVTATDAAGNRSNGSFSVTVRDTTPPLLTLPADQAVEATSGSGATDSAAFTASATDLVTASPAIAYTVGGTTINSSYVFALGMTTVAVTATDAAGNHSSGSFTVTVQDTTAPVLTVPADQTVEATSARGATDAGAFTASATSLLTPSPIIAYAVGGTAIDSSYTFALGTTSVQVTATDADSNQSRGSFIVTVRDTTAPTLTLPADQTVEATSARGAADSAAFSASATDAVTASPVIAYAVSGTAIDSSYTFALGTTTVQVTATDAAGNVSGGSFTVTVRDTTAPVLTVPANQTIEATRAAGATDSAAFSASATDLVTASPAIAYAVGGTTINSNYVFELGTTTVAVTATDAAGNRSNGSFSVTVRDSTPPLLTLPANQTVEATSAAGATDSAAFSASATDAVAASPTIAYAVGGTTITSSFTFALGTTTVQVSATDAAGNQSSGSFTITVRDTTPPVLTVPADQTIEAASAAGATDSAAFTASATDLVTANPVIAYTVGGTAIDSSYAFALGMTTVQVTATDLAGNVSRGSFTVTVRDTTAPLLTVPPDQTVEATSANGASDSAAFSASATDAVTASPVIAYAVGSTTIDRSYTFALGATTVIVTATDAAGNQNSGSFTVTVRDTTPPVLTVPANRIVEASSAAGATDSAAFTASATDAITASPTIAYAVGDQAIDSNDTFALGTTTVQVSAADAAGNVSRGSFTVTVLDTIAPSLTLPADQTVETASAAGATDSAAFTASATDLVSANPVIAYTVGGQAIDSSYMFPLGTTMVQVSATDAAGNISSGSFTVTVRDSTAPVLTVPANQTVEATSGSGATDAGAFTASATSLVSASPTIAYAVGGTAIASSYTFALGTTTVQVTATDAADNQSTGSFTVTVRDTTAPVLIVPPNQTVAATSTAGATDSAAFSASATDAVTASPTIAYAVGGLTIDRSYTFALGTTTVTVTATDAAGNHSRGSFTVQVTTAPAIAIGPAALPSAQTGASYGAAFAASGGTAPYTFRVAAGALPAGLTLSSAGVLDGTPLAAGLFGFTVTAADAGTGDGSDAGSQAYTLVVNAPGFRYDPATRILTVTGTTAPNTFAFSQATTQDAAGTLRTTDTFLLDGDAETFPDSALARVVVSAAGSGNTASLTTSDTYTGSDGQAHETQEEVVLGGGAGQLYRVDAAGNGTLLLTLAGFTTEYAAMGHADSGLLTATPGLPNRFVSAGGAAYMDSGSALYAIGGARYVYGFAAGAGDDAYHYDGSGPSALVMSGTAYSFMLGSDHGQTFFNEAVGFTTTDAIAQHPGQDTAFFYDSPRDDVFVGDTGSSYLYADTSSGSFAEFDYAQGFALVYAYSFVGGTDDAYVYDTTVNHVDFYDPAHGHTTGYHRLA